MDNTLGIEGQTPAKITVMETCTIKEDGLTENEGCASGQHRDNTASTKVPCDADTNQKEFDLEAELDDLEAKADGFKEVRLFTETAQEREQMENKLSKPDYRVHYEGIHQEFTRSNDCHFSHEEITLDHPKVGSIVSKCRRFLRELQKQSQPLGSVGVYQQGPCSMCIRQTTATWLRLRRDRVTSSTFGRIVKRRKFDPANSMVKFVQNHFNPCWYQGEIESLAYGVMLESSGVQKYIAHKPHMEVKGTGMWTYGARPWLGGSPDGLVVDTTTGEEGLLEIKCPVRGKSINFDELAKQKGFYMIKQADGSYELSTKEEYYYQVQGCLEILNREFCDFSVVTEKDIYVQRIKRDREFFNTQMLPKLQELYFRFFLPNRVKKAKLLPAKIPVDPPKEEQPPKEKGLKKRKPKAKKGKKKKGNEQDEDSFIDDAVSVEEDQKPATPAKPVEMKDVMEWKYTFIGKDVYEKYFKDLVFPILRDSELDLDHDSEDEAVEDEGREEEGFKLTEATTEVATKGGEEVVSPEAHTAAGMNSKISDESVPEQNPS